MALSAAVHAREVLRFDYTPASPPAVDDDDGVQPLPRRVQPRLLVAWDLGREDWRTFRAGRITPRTPTGPRGSWPAKAEAQGARPGNRYPMRTFES